MSDFKADQADGLTRVLPAPPPERAAELERRMDAIERQFTPAIRVVVAELAECLRLYRTAKSTAHLENLIEVGGLEHRADAILAKAKDLLEVGKPNGGRS